MSYTVYRLEHGGRKCVVGCADDPVQAAILIDEDRKKIDWEPAYIVTQDGEEGKEEDNADERSQD